MNNVGTDFLNLGRYSEAQEWFDKMLRVAPNDATGWFNKGVVCGKQGN